MTGQRTIGRQAETRRFARTRPAKGQRGGGQKGQDGLIGPWTDSEGGTMRMGNAENLVR